MTEKPSLLQSMGLQRVGHDLVAEKQHKTQKTEKKGQDKLREEDSMEEQPWRQSYLSVASSSPLRLTKQKVILGHTAYFFLNSLKVADVKTPGMHKGNTCLTGDHVEPS